MSSRNVVDLRKRKAGASFLDQAPLPLRLQKRVSPVRAKRRRVRLIVSSIAVAVLIDLALGASYLSYLPQYSIVKVNVEGAKQVPATLISDYAESILYDGSHHFLSRANFFLYPEATIEQDIPREFPRVASAIVDKTFLSNTITINVIERQPYAVWCDQDSCYQMDQSGFIYAQAQSSASTTGDYIFSGGVSTSTPIIGQTFAPGHTQGLTAFLQLLNQAGYAPLGATISSDQDFTVPLSQGFSVYASFGEDPGTLVNNLQLVLSSSALSGQQQNLDYVDLRFGDKVYYKLKGEAQTQAQSNS